MHFEKLVPGPRGLELKLAIVTAIERVYSENVDRFDADGIGDDTTVFGFTVSRNLWHVIELAVKDVVGVEARRVSNTFFLVVDDTYELYFCKAPPGARTVHALHFDESYVRGQITARNGSHLQLRLDLAGGTPVALDAHPSAPYAAVVHFGDHEDGFSHAVAGVPYRLPDGKFGWEWEEPFEDGPLELDVVKPTAGPQPDRDHGGFGLTLREDNDAAVEQ